MPNLFDQLTSTVETIDSVGFTVVPLYRMAAKADARVLHRSSGALRARRIAAASEALGRLPIVSSTSQHAKAVLVHFADDWISEVGEALEAQDRSALDVSDLVAGQEILVNFCDANPTKALHIGHLRNLALGHALASVLEAAGAQVMRQSQVSDYCRSMGEALAGYVEQAHGATPAIDGVKSDHFVGQCYTSYARTVAAQPEVGDDPAMSQEGTPRDDLAEKLLQRWARGDPETLEVWETLRGWALDGHCATLKALGIRFDRFVYESDYLDAIKDIIQIGLAKNVLTRTDAGAVVYETADRDYPLLLLARADGFPTQHLRTMALWQTLTETLTNISTIELVGDEWRSYVRHHKKLMDRITPLGDRRHPTDNLQYGMVRLEGHAVKSRDGAPPLIDEMLEQLLASDQLNEVVRLSDGRIATGQLVRLVALGRYLMHPKRKPIDLSANDALGMEGGMEWTIARAAADAWHSRHDGSPDPAPDDPFYRALVLQSQVHRQLVAHASHHHEVHDLVRFYGHLCAQYLSQPRVGRHGRVMRMLLGRGLATLGLAQLESSALIELGKV